MGLAAGGGRTGVGLSFYQLFCLQRGPVRYKIEMSVSSWSRMALAEVRVSLLVAVTIPKLCCGSVFSSARDEATHPADISSHMLHSVLGKFCLSSCRMKTIKAHFCSWSSQNIPHGFPGLKAVMCGKATLPGSCALEFRGKWGSSSLSFNSMAASSFISMHWGLAVVELGSSFLKFTLCHLWAWVLSDRIDSVGAAALLMFPFMFMFVPTEWPLAQTTWTCITRKLTTLEPPVCHYPS